LSPSKLTKTNPKWEGLQRTLEEEVQRKKAKEKQEGIAI